MLSALKARDPGGAGVITCKQLVQAVQAPNFGLNEDQARSLLTDFNAQLKSDDAKVAYRSFVNHLRLPDEHSNQPGQDPTLFYQQSYVNRVRAHAAHLIETVAAMKVTTLENGDLQQTPGPRESGLVLPPVAAFKPNRDSHAPRGQGTSTTIHPSRVACLLTTSVCFCYRCRSTVF